MCDGMPQAEEHGHKIGFCEAKTRQSLVESLLLRQNSVLSNGIFLSIAIAMVYHHTHRCVYHRHKAHIINRRLYNFQIISYIFWCVRLFFCLERLELIVCVSLFLSVLPFCWLARFFHLCCPFSVLALWF